VLYRTNAQSRLFEESCRRAGLRYNLVGGFSFYERAEVKDIIAYLKLALNRNDSIALTRVINTPPRGIGKTTLDDIERRARDFGVSHWMTIHTIVDQNLLPARAVSALKSFRDVVTGLAERSSDPAEPISEIVKAAVIDSGYERALKDENTEEAEGRLLNLEELVNAAAESEQRGERAIIKAGLTTAPRALRSFSPGKAEVSTPPISSRAPVPATRAARQARQARQD
jgi:DNA helicase-2/ATP-dependent DNA helicase PcrA